MRIGEVARRSGISARMLRHYDELGLVVPSGRSATGYREYAPSDLRRLFQVEGLRSLGMSLREVAEAVDDGEHAPAPLVERLLDRTRERIAEEQALLRRLEAVDAVNPADWASVLDVVARLHELSSGTPARRQRAALTADGESLPPGALVEALVAEREQNVVGALRWALVRLGDGAVTPLVGALDHPDPAVRARLLDALAELPGRRSTDALAGLLDDGNARLRTRAAIAIVGRESDETRLARAREVLVDAICDGENDVAAAEALAAHTDGDGREAVVGRLAHRAESSAPEVRVRIAQALGELPGAAALALLGELAADPDPATSLTARGLLSAR
ncbi:MerR family transcriptional regulator [Gordonia sp. (in: high G+C Gram-positive bacteria)]|uniref:MerR family transcriptional regulator n=1 Tax=Gordonia sp. (in: high G+C Gram-positive bacteria) TaxID=84139 RepID=UPI0039E5E362